MSDGGKGSRQRPTNKIDFEDNYDRIFGKKKLPIDMECKHCGKLFAKAEGVAIANSIGGELLCPKCSSPSVVPYKGVQQDDI